MWSDEDQAAYEERRRKRDEYYDLVEQVQRDADALGYPKAIHADSSNMERVTIPVAQLADMLTQLKTKRTKR